MASYYRPRSRNRRQRNYFSLSCLILVLTTPIFTFAMKRGENERKIIEKKGKHDHGKDPILNLLIKWRTIEGISVKKVNSDEGRVINYNNHEDGTKKRFSEILKSKTSDFQTEDLISNQIDDSGVEVTVDIPEYGVTAVTGPASYFNAIDLENIEAVKYVEEDFVRANVHDNIFSWEGVGSSSNEILPFGITNTQSMLIPTSDNIMKICIIDTGYDEGHYDLPNSSNPSHHVEGIPDETYNEGWNNDYQGHGTLVAGIIAAIHNTQGVVGVNGDPTKVGLIIGKGLNWRGQGQVSTVLKVVSSCVERKANVINLSLSGPKSLIEEDVFGQAYDEGVLLVAAAGNAKSQDINKEAYPAMLPSVISVAATDSNRKRSHFSVINSQVEISGPGRFVVSTFPNNRSKMVSGTSMSAPYVAAVLLKVWAHFPQCSNFQLRQAMLKTAINFEDCTSELGRGDIQAKAMYDNLKNFGCDFGGTDDEWNSRNLNVEDNSISAINGAVGGCNEKWSSDFLTSAPTPLPVPTSTPTMNPTVKPKQPTIAKRPKKKKKSARKEKTRKSKKPRKIKTHKPKMLIRKRRRTR